MGGSSSVPLSKASQLIKNEVQQHAVVMYSKNHCPYCVRAKDELNDMGIGFLEKNLNDKAKEDPANVESYIKGLMDLTHQKTVPQIFICGKFIGGYTEMHALKDSLHKLVSECSSEGTQCEKGTTVRPKL